MRRLTALLFTGALLAPVPLTAQDVPPPGPGAPPRMHPWGHPVGPHGMGPAEGVCAPQMLVSPPMTIIAT